MTPILTDQQLADLVTLYERARTEPGHLALHLSRAICHELAARAATDDWHTFLIVGRLRYVWQPRLKDFLRQAIEPSLFPRITPEAAEATRQKRAGQERRRAVKRRAAAKQAAA